MNVLIVIMEQVGNDHIKRIHLKIKDIECAYCEFKTFKKTDLNVHIKRVHANFKPHQCSHCEYKSTAKTRLLEHIKRKHN